MYNLWKKWNIIWKFYQSGTREKPKNIFNEIIIKEKKKYSAKEAISSFVSFLKGLYENIKLYYFYEESISVKNIINLLFYLLKIYEDENLTIQYIIFFNEYYNLSILNDLGLKYTNNFTNINALISYLNNLFLITNEKYIFNHIYNISQILSDIKIQQNLSNINSNSRNRTILSYLEDSLSQNNSNNNQYIIFNKYSTKNKYNKYKNINNNKNNYNFLLKFINYGYNNNTLKTLHIKETITILNQISKAKYNPYIYIQDISTNVKMQILSLIDRKDLGKNILIPQNKKSLKLKIFLQCYITILVQIIIENII